MRFDDLTNQTINRILFIRHLGMNSHGKALWLCLCPYCDNTFESLAASIKTGRTISCGCQRAKHNTERFSKNLVGLTFGDLTVLSYGGNPRSGLDNRPRRQYRCKCVCGTEKIIRADDLLSGKTISCTCKQKEIVTKHGKYKTKGYRSLLARLRRENVSIYDSEWTLEMDEALRRYFRSCVVCNGTHKLSVDHVYPLSKGYGLKLGNAVVLCHSCNASKSNKMPENLSSDVRNKILSAAEEFKIAWESGFRA